MIRRTLVVLTLLLATALPAAAQVTPDSGQAPGAPGRPGGPPASQSANRIPPPTPPATESLGMSVLLYYTVLIVLGGATIAISVMPGKRSHQD